MRAQIFYRVSFRAIVDQTHQKEEIQGWQKQYVAAIDSFLGVFAESVVIVKPLGF